MAARYLGSDSLCPDPDRALAPGIQYGEASQCLGLSPPAPEAIAVTPRDPGSAMLRQDLWTDFAPTLT